MHLWQILVPVALGLVLIWVAMVVALYVVARRDGDPAGLRQVLRLVPTWCGCSGGWPPTRRCLAACAGG